MSSIKSTECKIYSSCVKCSYRWCTLYSVQCTLAMFIYPYTVLRCVKICFVVAEFFFHNSALTTKSKNQPKTSDCCKKRDWEKSIKQNTISWHKEKWTACILNVINWMRVARTMETHITYTKHIYIIVSSHNSPCSHLTRNKHWLRHRERAHEITPQPKLKPYTTKQIL